MNPELEDRPPQPPTPPPPGLPVPWVWLGAAFLVMLFTPLGPLWPLVLIGLGALVWTKRLRLEQGILWAGAAVIGGVLSVGGWSGFAPNFSLLGGGSSDRQVLSLEGIRKLEARTFNGAIRITPARGEARLTIRRRGDVSVTVSTTDDVLSIQAKRPFFTWNTGANLELELPATLELHLDTSNGPIEVTAPLKRLEASTSNGRLVTQGTGPGGLTLENTNGPIEISDTQGEIEAHTSNGDVRLTNASETTFRLETSNGAIHLERLNLAANTRNSARSSNGPINLTNVRAPAGLVLRGDTSNATVDVQLPGFEVKLESERFEARNTGLGPAELELDTSNARINVRP